MKFKILHTNDIHSRFENFSKVVTHIKNLKDANTLILDAGDFHDFMSIELQGTNGVAGGRLLKCAGYDAIAIGNNEGFSGINNIECMTSAELINYLSCNLYKDDKTNIKGIKRSIIINKSGINFLIIGATPNCNEFFSLEGMYASDPIEEIEKEIYHNKGKYDICILLSHLGINTDRKIAENLDGVHIIIGGHSHTLMDNADVINNTIVHQVGKYGECIGVLEFEYEDGKVISFHSETINTKGVEKDEEIIKILIAQKEIAIDILSEPLYEVHKDIWHDVVEENPITNLLADGLREVFQCDIGLINSGVISSGIRKGAVSNRKLLEISPSPLNPTYVELTGKDIREALELSLNPEICLQDGIGAGFRGKYLGRLHISGAKIIHNGKGIVSIELDNGEFKEDKVYRVVTSDYLQRGTGYESLGRGTNEKYDKDYTRDVLRAYLNKKEFVDKAFVDRWVKI